ncbi:MAG: DegT/DnrJ/EryC1/StrS family aminotransferase [Pirellulales bacterium]|nr:DegT/DnrJ/EryC1/StrS family aminotransferase [Pirellulales bacterium]
MWSRKRFDISWRDLMVGAARVFFSPEPDGTARRVERFWPDPEHTLVCLSVRSGFDLLLETLNLPRGSEVLVSAITIPHMVKILEHHGLTPVPVDLDPATMAPTADAWRRAVTPATRAILVAHLFGGRIDVTPILELAQRHKLYVFEDCAQAFTGFEYAGHPEADVSMFSFGAIKSTTALEGAVLRVRDGELLARMRTAQAGYPRQGRLAFGRRLLKYGLLKFLSFRPVAGFFVFVCRRVGCDYDAWVNGAVRGFPGADLIAKIRQQPPAPLLALMERRFRRFNAERWQRHAAKGRELTVRLNGAVLCPGTSSTPHNYWVFPVLVDEPPRLIEQLVRSGYDATQGVSLCVVPPPADRSEQKACFAEEFLKKVVFLPFYPELPTRRSQRMAAVVLDTLNPQPLPEKPAVGSAETA